MYGYGKKRVWTSTSGWESSHFGGYNRLIYDYPYIQMDFNGVIEVPEELRKVQGIYIAEKLIKIYMMKLKEAGYEKNLNLEIVTKRDFIGREKKYQSISLGQYDVLAAVKDKFREFAPLFDHYGKEILGSKIMIEIPDDGKGQPQSGGEKGDDQNQDGQDENDGDSQSGDREDGEGDGDGEDGDGEKENKDGSGSGEGGESGSGGGYGGSEFEAIKKLIDEMKESKPISRWGNLGNGEYGTPKFITYTEADNKRFGNYEFSGSEKSNAELLLKKLDISFDPKSDHVKNLKLGTLDTSKIAEVPAGNLSVYKQVLEDQDTKEFAVCVLADMSGSMDDGVRLQTQFKVLNSLYLALSEIIPESDLHVYGHTGGSTEPKIYTFCSPYSPNYSKNIQHYYNISNGSNYDGLVIQEVHKKIREKTDRPVILVSISDGQPCDSIDNMKQILERARRDQFVTIGIGIDAEYVKELYQYSRVVSQEKIKDMPIDVAGIINHVVKTEFQ